METANQPVDQWRETLEKILQYYADLPYTYGDVITYVVVSRDRNHFMLIHEGWENHLRVHVMWFMPKSAMTKYGFIMMALKTASLMNSSPLAFPKTTLFLLSIHRKSDSILDMRSHSFSS